MVLENLGDHIRTVRKARGLSQEALARSADVSLNLVGKLELGMITNPHYTTLAGIARALDVRVEELVEFVDEEVPGEELTSQEWAWRQNARLHGLTGEEWDDYLRTHNTVEELAETWHEIHGESGMLHAMLAAHKWQRPQDRGRRRTLARGLRDLRMRRYGDVRAAALVLRAEEALVDEIFKAMRVEAETNV